MPATANYSNIQISVSTSGKGAFLAKKIKEDIIELTELDGQFNFLEEQKHINNNRFKQLMKEIENNGKVIVLYKYAKNKRIFSFLTGKRQIEFKINLQTGELRIDKITEI